MSNLEYSLSPTGHARHWDIFSQWPEICSGLDVVQYDDATLKAELENALEIIHSRSSTHRMPHGKEQEFRYFNIRHHTS